MKATAVVFGVLVLSCGLAGALAGGDKAKTVWSFDEDMVREAAKNFKTEVGEHIECFFDGKKHLEVDDTTFPQAGMIGLWSKADAQTYFDDLTLVDTE